MVNADMKGARIPRFLGGWHSVSGLVFGVITVTGLRHFFGWKEQEEDEKEGGTKESNLGRNFLLSSPMMKGPVGTTISLLRIYFQIS